MIAKEVQCLGMYEWGKKEHLSDHVNIQALGDIIYIKQNRIVVREIYQMDIFYFLSFRTYELKVIAYNSLSLQSWMSHSLLPTEFW